MITKMSIQKLKCVCAKNVMCLVSWKEGMHTSETTVIKNRK